MNLRNVLRTYSLLRSLTDDESALLDTLRAMNESERELLVESLGPVRSSGKKPPKATVKPRVYERCVQCDKTKGHRCHTNADRADYHEFQSAAERKSARAASLAEQIKTSTRLLDTDIDKTPCQNCGEYADSNIHHLASMDGYHEFQPVEKAAAVGE